MTAVEAAWRCRSGILGICVLLFFRCCCALCLCCCGFVVVACVSCRVRASSCRLAFCCCIVVLLCVRLCVLCCFLVFASCCRVVLRVARVVCAFLFGLVNVRASRCPLRRLALLFFSPAILLWGQFTGKTISLAPPSPLRFPLVSATHKRRI